MRLFCSSVSIAILLFVFEKCSRSFSLLRGNNNNYKRRLSGTSCYDGVSSAPAVLTPEVLIALYRNNSVLELGNFYRDNRVAFNIILGSILRTNSSFIAEELVNALELSGTVIIADTINSLISSALSKRRYEDAETLYKRYFSSDDRIPSQRTLNILMEAFREERVYESKVLFYLSEHTRFNLRPDQYAYSTLVRMSNSVEMIISIIKRAQKEQCITGPLLRCAVETLGQIAAPYEALFVAIDFHRAAMLSNKNLSVSSDTNKRTTLSPATGDSLIIALLQRKQADIDNSLSPGMKTDSRAGNFSWSQWSTQEDKQLLVQAIKIAEIDIEDILKQSLSLRSHFFDCEVVAFHFLLYKVVPVTGKGLTTALTAVQRAVKRQQQQQHSQVDGGKPKFVTFGDSVALFELRDRIAQLILAEIKEDVELSQSNGANSVAKYSVATHKKSYLPSHSVINGRLCDSLIRSFFDQPDRARGIWLTELLPTATRLEKIRPGVLHEIAAKAFEALMYVSAINVRADIGLEVAKTARTRGFTREECRRLAFAYSRGLDELLNGVVVGSDSCKSGGTLLDDHPVGTAFESSNASSRSATDTKEMRAKSIITTTTGGDKTVGSFFNRILNEGLERSIESELGCLLDTNRHKSPALKRIRVQFAETTRNVPKLP